MEATLAIPGSEARDRHPMSLRILTHLSGPETDTRDAPSRQEES